MKLPERIKGMDYMASFQGPDYHNLVNSFREHAGDRLEQLEVVPLEGEFRIYVKMKD